MAESEDSILKLLKESYVPFLMKVLSHNEKNNRLKSRVKKKRQQKYQYLCKVFQDGNVQDRIEVFHKYRSELEEVYKSYSKRLARHARYQNKISLERERGSKLCNANSSESEHESSSESSEDESSTYTDGEKGAVRVLKKRKKHRGSSGSIKRILFSNHCSYGPKDYRRHREPSPISTPKFLVEKDKCNNDHFICVTCRYKTTDLDEFVQHSRTFHRAGVFLWCKDCGKCCDNTKVLLNHIREGSCKKDDIIFRCCVKHCPYFTTSGHRFVNHLKLDHIRRNFLFCFICQKTFTLPQLFVIHKQDECPLKERVYHSDTSWTSDESLACNPSKEQMA